MKTQTQPLNNNYTHRSDSPFATTLNKGSCIPDDGICARAAIKDKWDIVRFFSAALTLINVHILRMMKLIKSFSSWVACVCILSFIASSLIQVKGKKK